MKLKKSKEKYFKEAIEEYKNKYSKSVDYYKKFKLIRDKIKEELNRI
ncbi:hypothetical protein P5F48_13755 [Clostridium perfringens]|nr:hypothetical protein [Clostridium perfringens]MDK0928491.1 hypothetical protein [Clostridium perfringens]MDK0934228.1 hypothetical protein [Clostridium perfringens]MDT7918717.1 hypothetical protein [Clostridium perfringens]MDT7938299.1 hypothetical protein [Clostridium perfringens]MDT7941446.1 hypothetical protein [Clostridium perfringens]